MERRRIVAMGGGGFGSSPGDPALDQYVLDVSGATTPRICLLPTASGDPEEQIHRFYRAYEARDCDPTHVSLFRMGSRPIDLRELLLGQDVIYAGGGSMLNLIAIWRAHGLDEILREAWERGIVLCGISAGSMCWFEAGVTKSFGSPRPAAGLGFLRGSNSVHHHSEPDRRPCFVEAVRTEELPPGYGVDDGVGILFGGIDFIEAVSARPAAGAWWVDAGGEERLETVELEQPAHDAPDDVSIEEFRAERLRAFGTGR
ncbi:MAG: hypothetical protein QOG63_2612 [Thermoleophilaceae bacterium]|nr:hypothetical protein [Thermoleophilaceae bacterium]